MSYKPTDKGEYHAFERDAEKDVSVVSRNQLENQGELKNSIQGQDNTVDSEQSAVIVEATDSLSG